MGIDAMPLIERARALPALPGVYVFKDRRARVLYVGKSISLRHRVLLYLSRTGDARGRIRRMMALATDLEFFVTDTEEEALVLEYEFINRYSPRFNVVFRDDKSYPYLKVTREEFPRIVFTRRPKEGEGDVLGPFPSADALRRTLRFMRSIFPVRSCSFPSSRLHTVRACLDFHIKRCLAPCEGKVDAQAYQTIVRDAVLFLKGDDSELTARIQREMKEAAGQWRFEEAARLKRAIDALERIRAKQHVSSVREEDLDVIAVASSGTGVAVQQMFVREGRVRGQSRRVFARTATTPAELLAEVLKLTYINQSAVPGEIAISEEIAERELVERGLARKFGHRVTIHVPRRGRKRALVQLALKNARLQLAIRGGAGAELEDAVAELATVLELPRPPRVIECFDISHLGGRETVASMVVARAGRMDRSSYRRFRIRGVEGIDDFASMREVVTRRYRRVSAQSAKLPDLVLLDGGKGQLSAGIEALLALGLVQVPIAALAKREEVLFAPRFPDGIALPEHSPARKLVERVRDEAHRFAISYHRTLRSRRTTVSELDAIRGIGPVTRARLLSHLGSVSRVKEATIDGIAAVPGVTLAQARSVWTHFHEDAGGPGETSPTERELS